MSKLPIINIDSLARVEQLPIIAEQLYEVKAMVEAKVEELIHLECTEENVKDVRKNRAEMNKVLTAFEDKRKEIKNAVMTPYTDFEKVYKECVGDPLKNADLTLKGKIDAVETALKGEKENNARDYFNEYAESVDIDFVPFERVGIDITLNTSEKKLKETIKAFLDKVYEEIATIGTLPDAVEILTEYKSSLNLANAMATVSNRHKAIAEEKARAEARALREAEERARVEEVNNKAQELSKPLEAPSLEPTEEVKPTEPIYTVKFSVSASMSMLKELKNFMNERGINYANIE